MKFLPVLYIIVFSTLSSCSGVSDGDEAAATANGAFSSLRLGQVSSADSPVEFSAAIETRESIVVLDTNEIFFTADNSQILGIQTDSSSVPTSARTSDVSFEFSNFNGDTVDVNVTRLGITEGPFKVTLPNFSSINRGSLRMLDEDLGGKILRAADAVTFVGCATQGALENVTFSSRSLATAKQICNSPLVKVLKDTVESGNVDNQPIIELQQTSACSNGQTFTAISVCASAVGGETVEEVLEENPDLVSSIPLESIPESSFIESGALTEEQQGRLLGAVMQPTQPMQTEDIDLELNRTRDSIRFEGLTVFGFIVQGGFEVGEFIGGDFVVFDVIPGRIVNGAFVVQNSRLVNNLPEQQTSTETPTIGGNTACSPELNATLNSDRDLATLTDGRTVLGLERFNRFEIGEFNDCIFIVFETVSLDSISNIEENLCTAELNNRLNAERDSTTIFRPDASSFQVRGEFNSDGSFTQIQYQDCNPEFGQTFSREEQTEPIIQSTEEAVCLDQIIEATLPPAVPEESAITLTGLPLNISGLNVFQPGFCDTSGFVAQQGCFEIFGNTLDILLIVDQINNPIPINDCADIP